MDNIYYIETGRLNALYDTLKKKYKVFSPVVKEPNFTKETDYSYKELPKGAPLVFNPYRVVEPLKCFFTHAQDKVAEYFKEEEPIKDLPQVIIFGVKSCDIAGHKIQDFVYLEGVEVDPSTSLRVNGERPFDSFHSLRVVPSKVEGRSRTIDALYRVRRENTILISSDCTDFKEVCHCLAWEILPHPTAGFDLNLSPLNDGYLVEVGSKKGEGLIRQYKEYFIPAKEAQLPARRIKREKLIECLKRHLLPKHLVSRNIVQGLMRDGYNLDTWKQFMLACVECGGCNFICDTCHCFLLTDKKEAGINKKARLWDACLYANYARVAGGANPLKRRADRLRFRFTKKFDFFVDNLGMPACCGCGRCIEVCPAKIDIREVLRDLAKKLNEAQTYGTK